MNHLTEILSLETLPVQLTGTNVVWMMAISALEVIIAMALLRGYSIEVEGDTSENGLRGGLKLHPVSSESNKM